MKSYLSILFHISAVLFFGSIFLQKSSVVDAARRRHYLLKKPQCTEASLWKVEGMIARAQAFGPEGRKLPETFDQMKAFCKESAKILRDVETFMKNCFEKTVKDYASMAIYTIRVNMKRFCGKEGSKQTREWLKLGPCANKHIQPYDICFQKFINQTKVLINIADDKKKFPHTCCNFVEGVRCGEAFLNNVPCIRPYANMFMDIFRGASGQMVDLACGDYNEQTDACERLGPPPKPVKPNKNRYKTAALVLIELLASIKDASTVPEVG